MIRDYNDIYDNTAELAVYHRYVSKKVIFVAGCVVFSLVAFGLELSMGKADIGFVESYQILWDHITGNIAVDPVGLEKDHIVWDMRLPRGIGAFMVGITLAVTGAAMQSALKNPLADPYTTGISSGASLGAILAISMGFCLIPGVIGYNAIVVNAFLFSLIPTIAIVMVSKYKRATSTTMILTGLAVMYMFSAFTSMLMLIADPNDTKTAYIWNMGNVGAITWDALPFILGGTLVAAVAMQLMASRINVLAMSDEAAISMGVDAKKVRIVLMIVVAATVALCVSFTGTIGFIGLIAPHMVRMAIGSDNRYLMPASAAFGGMLLLYADCLAKTIGTTGMPVGVITAAIGGPLFLYVIFMHKKKIWS